MALMRALVRIQSDGYGNTYIPPEPLKPKGGLIAKHNTEHGGVWSNTAMRVKQPSIGCSIKRRLRLCYERRDDMRQAFFIIACSLLCWHCIQKFC